MPDLASYAIWAPTLLLATVRVTGIMLVAPVFAHAVVPVKLRVLLSVAIGLAVVGRLAEPVNVAVRGAELWAALGCEFVIGAAMGYAARLLFAGVELGAFHVSQQMGLALAAVAAGARGEAGGGISGLFRLLAILAFLAIGGHRILLGGLIRSFETVPPLSFPAGEAVLSRVVSLLGASFVLALKLAAPALIAMLLATVALGLLQRTMPQCNLLSIGLPARALLGLLVLALALAALMPLMEAATSHLDESLRALLVVGS
jgi:flagellar biosynthetic protein FliR